MTRWRRTEQIPRWAVVAATGIALTLGLSIAGYAWSGGPREVLAAWVEALATLFGLSAAIVAGTFAAQTMRTDAQQRRVAQAASVSAWVEGLDHDASLVVLNGSANPVYELTASFSYLGHPINVDMVLIGPVPPSVESQRRPIEPMTLTALAQIKATQFRSWAPPVPLDVAITFRDAAGVRWMRDGVGRLREFKDE